MATRTKSSYATNKWKQETIDLNFLKKVITPSYQKLIDDTKESQLRIKMRGFTK